MRIDNRIAKFVDRKARDRANLILGYGDIEFSMHDQWLHASIDDDRADFVEVVFKLDADQVTYGCDCDWFQTHAPTPCAHLLAAIAQAEDAKLISAGRLSKEAQFLPATAQSLASLPRRLGQLNGRGIEVAVDVARSLPPWRPLLQSLQSKVVDSPETPVEWPADKQIIYVIQTPATLKGGPGIQVEIQARQPKKNGEWRKPARLTLGAEDIRRLPDPQDREIIATMMGAEEREYYYRPMIASNKWLGETHARLLIPKMCATGRCMLGVSDGTIPLLWDEHGWEMHVDIARDEALHAYVVSGVLERTIQGVPARRPLSEPLMLTAGGFVFDNGRAAPLDDHGAFEWIALLREHKRLQVPVDQANELLAEFYRLPRLPVMNVPDDLRVEESTPAMQPHLRIRAPRKSMSNPGKLVGELSFQYGDEIIASETRGMGLFKAKERRLLRRDLTAEAAATHRIYTLGFRAEFTYGENKSCLLLPTEHMPDVVRLLTAAGWHVEADGKLYRQPGEFTLQVTSDIDWFDLRGKVQFGELSATLPQLLAALRKGETSVKLDDGTFGMVPEEWLKKYAPLINVGTTEDDALRFRRTQVGLLDALLVSQPRSSCDATFQHARDMLRNFSGVKPGNPPPTFQGELRPYQREALGWFDFLRDFGFGGCLADDMGLGKTVQVLALLDSRRLAAAAPAKVASNGASAIGQNGKSNGSAKASGSGSSNGSNGTSNGSAKTNGVITGEATDASAIEQRINGTGNLNGKALAAKGNQGIPSNVVPVVNGTGANGANGTSTPPGNSTAASGSLAGVNGAAGRRTAAAKGHKPSLVVVPRSLIFNWQQEAARFAPNLRVLDHSDTARPRTGEHFSDYDLILTTYGTLRRDVAYVKDQCFDYVVLDEAQAVKNPQCESAKAVRLLQGDHRLVLSGTPVQNHLGDLWSLFEFLNPGMLGTAAVFGGGASRSTDTRDLLARGLRPFILRRTKEQVATELPKKLEQTIYCDLEPIQRKLYNELRDHYRASLLQRVAEVGMARAKIQILEALLRLRQAACHPGLIDKKRVDESSAKLDMLLPRLAEATDEGHKALVFSQFTSLLSIVRRKLDADGIPYEYLDGKTRNRQECVERFQSDPKKRLFLISLKAGGVGLNLTAADYVFLLDPWWNPAVESQAIDRTHRIGQDKQVFACRLIARDTVEEKVLALQQTKRELADAIINADNSLIRTIGRGDLELLLS